MIHDYRPAFLGGGGVRGGWWAVIGCPKMERLFLLAELSVDVSEGV